MPDGKRARFYSINVMRARHPAWFRHDLERLFWLLATRAIRPRVAEQISFDEVVETHRRLEAGGLEGKLVLCLDLPSRATAADLSGIEAFTASPREKLSWLASDIFVAGGRAYGQSLPNLTSSS